MLKRHENTAMGLPPSETTRDPTVMWRVLSPQPVTKERLPYRVAPAQQEIVARIISPIYPQRHTY